METSVPTAAADCSNCAAPLPAEYKFCPHCSQKAQVHRITLHEVSHDALHYFTHADKSLFALLRGLATRTGLVARDYVNGRRKSYFPPLNFFLLVGTVYVLVLSLAARHTPFDLMKEHPGIALIKDPAAKAKQVMLYQRQHAAIDFMNHYTNLISMAAAPLFSLVFWLFYRRGRYNYAEHLVAHLYLGGFTNLFFGLLMVPLSVALGIKQGSLASLALALVFFGGQVAYSSVFYYRFMDGHGGRAKFKAFGASLSAIVLWFLTTSTLVGIYMAMGFRKH